MEKVNTRLPYGQPLGKVPEAAGVQAAIDAKRVTLSNIFYAKNRKEWVFTVTLPLPRQLSAAGDVLMVTQSARDLSNLISTDAIPNGWSAAVLDNDGRL